MNFIRAFNQTLDYLETVIEDQIDEEKVSQISGYSLAMFSRLFSVMTEMSLSEYYRQRKLSCAAQRLISSEERIIDLALRYGYESPDSFSNAFKNQSQRGKEGSTLSRFFAYSTHTNHQRKKNNESNDRKEIRLQSGRD